MAVDVTSHVNVFVSVCLPLWYICLASLLVEPANREAAAMSLNLGKDPSSPGTQLDSSKARGKAPR